MFDFLKKLFKGDESKKTDSKPVKKTTKPKSEPSKPTVTKPKTAKKESKKTKPKNEAAQLKPVKKIDTYENNKNVFLKYKNLFNIEKLSEKL